MVSQALTAFKLRPFRHTKSTGMEEIGQDKLHLQHSKFVANAHVRASQERQKILLLAIRQETLWEKAVGLNEAVLISHHGSQLHKVNMMQMKDNCYQTRSSIFKKQTNFISCWHDTAVLRILNFSTKNSFLRNNDYQ